MAALRVTERFAVGAALLAACVLAAAVPAQAQQPPPPMPPARIIVTGEGSVDAPADYAEINGGVTTSAKTAKEATDANSKLMTAVIAALRSDGIEAKDIQTSRFGIQATYAAPPPANETKLTGYSVSNHVTVKVRLLNQLSDILDSMVAAGANDVANMQFLHTDMSKELDQARAAAIADARRKAEIYAQAAGLKLGNVVWITEEPAYAASPQFAAVRFAAAAPVPIAPGEDTLRARITVGFDVAR